MNPYSLGISNPKPKSRGKNLVPGSNLPIGEIIGNNNPYSPSPPYPYNLVSNNSINTNPHSQNPYRRPTQPTILPTQHGPYPPYQNHPPQNYHHPKSPNHISEFDYSSAQLNNIPPSRSKSTNIQSTRPDSEFENYQGQSQEGFRRPQNLPHGGLKPSRNTVPKSIVPVKVYNTKGGAKVRRISYDFGQNLDNPGDFSKPMNSSDYIRSKLTGLSHDQMAKIYNPDYIKEITSSPPKHINQPSLNKQIVHIPQSSQYLSNKYYKSKSKNNFFKVLSKFVVVSFFVVSLGVFLFTYNIYNEQKRDNSVAGASETQSSSEDKYPQLLEYEAWITEKSRPEAKPEEDIDEDGLTNYEEFILQTDPLSAFTCSDTKSDSENLIELIDPASCEPIDIENEAVLEKYSEIINIPSIQENLLNKVIESEEEVEGDVSKNNSDSLLNLFAASSFEEIESLDIQDLNTQTENLKQKTEFLNLIDKVDSYILRYRSYEPYDRNYAPPVTGANYIDISLKYDVPLKYALAIARSESRFGTDRFDANGNLTRPGQFQNVYSIGLDDSGGNIGFSTWEEGVQAFGKWYAHYQSRGVDDCRKWRIYNPNGDYCQKIETLATEIQTYLDS